MKPRRAGRVERWKAYLNLVASGYSPRQIATAMKVSLATILREVDKPLAERPLHPPEPHAGPRAQLLEKAALMHGNCFP